METVRDAHMQSNEPERFLTKMFATSSRLLPSETGITVTGLQESAIRRRLESGFRKIVIILNKALCLVIFVV